MYLCSSMLCCRTHCCHRQIAVAIRLPNHLQVLWTERLCSNGSRTRPRRRRTGKRQNPTLRYTTHSPESLTLDTPLPQPSSPSSPYTGLSVNLHLLPHPIQVSPSLPHNLYIYLSCNIALCLSPFLTSPLPTTDIHIPLPFSLTLFCLSFIAAVHIIHPHLP